MKSLKQVRGKKRLVVAHAETHTLPFWLSHFIIKARAVAGYAGIRKQIKISKIFFFNTGLAEFHYSKSNEIQHIHDHQVQLLQATQISLVTKHHKGMPIKYQHYYRITDRNSRSTNKTHRTSQPKQLNLQQATSFKLQTGGAMTE